MNRLSDPSGFWGSIVSAGGAIVALLVAFGAPLTEDQQTALLGVLVAAGPLVAQFLIRRDAWAPTSVHREVAQIKSMTPTDDEDGAFDVNQAIGLLVLAIFVVILVKLLVGL